MKKIVFATLTFLALLFAMLPTSTAFAKKDGGAITLNIRNRTGSDVTLTLTTADGSKTTTYKVGTYVSTMPQGTYTYYARTPCGVQSGIFNLTRTSKQLYFSCKDGRTIQLTVPVRPVVQPAVEPAYAQASALTGSISGTLTFWGNLPSGYTIGLFSAPSGSEPALTTTTSGADGAFIFSGLAAGSYDVAFEGKGWNYRSDANGAGNFITVTAGGTANGNIIYPKP